MVTALEKAFGKMGAKVKTVDSKVGRNTVDVKNGTFLFNLGEGDSKVTVQHADTGDRHILVNVRTESEQRTRKGATQKVVTNDKWLCGHDERDWFVASATGINIWEAKQSLKPEVVVKAEVTLKMKKRHKRKNEIFKRQGEWFFVPAAPGRIPENTIVHKDEPISRGAGSKPHIVEEITRRGGDTVYVKGNSLLSKGGYEALPADQRVGYSIRTANATVFGRGYVKHKDHATIHLDGWHEIFMNNEKRTTALLFLD